MYETQWHNSDISCFSWLRALRFCYFNHFIVQSIIASPSEHFHGTERQSSAVWTFLRFRETELRRLNVFTMQRNRVPSSEHSVVQSDSAPPSERFVGQTVRVSLCDWWSQWPVHSNLERASRDQARQYFCLATSRLRRGALQGLSKASAFWPYQSCSERPIWASQICAVGCQHLPQTSY